MMEFIKKGDDPATAMDKARGSYGRTTEEDGAVKLIDPRKEQAEDYNGRENYIRKL